MSPDPAPTLGAFDAAEDLSSILAARPPPPTRISAVMTIGWRALLKIKHVPFQLFDVTASPIMFTLLFTYLFGGALAGSPREYLQFLIPGILVQTIVFITVYTGFGLNQDIDKGLFDRFRTLPIWQPAPIIGALAGDLVRYSIAASMVIVLGLILGFRPEGGALGVLAGLGLVMLFAFSLTWLWIIVGMKVKNPESVMTMSFLIIFPVTFASNIFVQLNTMPDWLQTVVRHNPVTHLVTASRLLMHGESGGTHTLWVVGWVIGIVAVAAPVALRMYHAER